MYSNALFYAPVTNFLTCFHCVTLFRVFSSLSLTFSLARLILETDGLSL